MKRKDLTALIVLAFVAAIISWVVAGMIFRTPADRQAEIPIVPELDTSFPDVKNDPNYTLFLNPQAINPALPVQIGDSQNSNPFR